MVLQLRIDWESKPTGVWFWKKSEVADGTVINNGKKQESWWDNITTEKELSKEESDELAKEISEDPEAKTQIDQLKKLWEKYKNDKLKDAQKSEYEWLMATIRTELDKDVPTVIEMNNEIDVNYYNNHPTEAANEAERIANDYQSMDDVNLVYNVLSRSDYLNNASRQKLNNVITNVINNLDEDTKSILANEATEN